MPAFLCRSVNITVFSSPWGPVRPYLRCYGSELVVTVQVELSAIRVTAEVQRLIPIDGEAQNAQEEHPHRAEEQGVELAYHRGRPELQHTHTHTHGQRESGFRQPDQCSCDSDSLRP